MCCSIYGVWCTKIVVLWYGLCGAYCRRTPFVNNYLCGITPICYDRHSLNSTTKVQQKIHKTVSKH